MASARRQRVLAPNWKLSPGNRLGNSAGNVPGNTEEPRALPGGCPANTAANSLANVAANTAANTEKAEVLAGDLLDTFPDTLLDTVRDTTKVQEGIPQTGRYSADMADDIAAYNAAYSTAEFDSAGVSAAQEGSHKQTKGDDSVDSRELQIRLVTGRFPAFFENGKGENEEYFRWKKGGLERNWSQEFGWVFAFGVGEVKTKK